MVALTQARALDFGDALPSDARMSIRRILEDEPRATRKVYASLVRKVWSLLIERRFDSEIRDWHALVHDVKAHLRTSDEPASERLTALADLLRESVSLSETSPARAVASRPNARRILERLEQSDGYLRRRQLLADLEMRSQNLSNVLTQLLAHNLVERRDKGKEAEFRITRLGRQLSGQVAQLTAPPSVHPDLNADVMKLHLILSRVTMRHYLTMEQNMFPTQSVARQWSRHVLKAVRQEDERIVARHTAILHIASSRAPIPGHQGKQAFTPMCVFTRLEKPEVQS